MSIREDLKIPLTMLCISFLNEMKYKGSYCGKRFIFEKIKEDDNIKLKVYLWKDVFNFENTSPNDIITKNFSFTKEGIEEGLDFIENYNVNEL